MRSRTFKILKNTFYNWISVLSIAILVILFLSFFRIKIFIYFGMVLILILLILYLEDYIFLFTRKRKKAPAPHPASKRNTFIVISLIIISIIILIIGNVIDFGEVKATAPLGEMETISLRAPHDSNLAFLFIAIFMFVLHLFAWHKKYLKTLSWGKLDSQWLNRSFLFPIGLFFTENIKKTKEFLVEVKNICMSSEVQAVIYSIIVSSMALVIVLFILRRLAPVEEDKIKTEKEPKWLFYLIFSFSWAISFLIFSILLIYLYSVYSFTSI